MQRKTDYNPNPTFQQQYNHEHLAAFAVKTYTKPKHLLQNQHPALDFGTFNEFKLDDLINLQSDGFNEAQVVRLAFVENNTVHLQEQGVQLFTKYSKNELGFICLYGRQWAGKSLLLDKIVNLSQFQGCHFSEDQTNSQKGLYLWAVPFSKGNLKIFLLDIDGYNDEVDSSYFMLLDLMMLMSSTVIVLAAPWDSQFQQMENIYKHMKKSRKRFVDDSQRQSTYWPHHLYCLYRYQEKESKSQKSLINMFKQFSFSILPDALQQKYAEHHDKSDLKTVELKKYGLNKKILSAQYIQKISSLFRDIYYKIQVKSYMNFRYTGTNIIKLLINAAQNLNLKNYMNIEKIFVKSMKELYLQAYQYHTQMYNQLVMNYLDNEEPVEIDFLIKIFKESSQEVLRSFDGLKVCNDLKYFYEEKLEKYMREKEKIIIQINKKKSKNKIKSAVPILRSQPDLEEVQNYIEKAKNVPKNYEQASVQGVAYPLASGFIHLDKTYKTQQRQLMKKTAIYTQKIKIKQSELQNIQLTKSKMTEEVTKTMVMKSGMEDKQKKLNKVMQSMKEQLSSLTKNRGIRDSLRKEKSAEVLRMEQVKLLKQKQKNIYMIQQLKAQSKKNKNRQLVDKLQKQIQQKIVQQRQLNAVIASNTKAPSIQIIRSATSLSSPHNSPRKIQSRPFKDNKQKIRVIHSPKM